MDVILVVSRSITCLRPLNDINHCWWVREVKKNMLTSGHKWGLALLHVIGGWTLRTVGLLNPASWHKVKWSLLAKENQKSEKRIILIWINRSTPPYYLKLNYPKKLHQTSNQRNHGQVRIRLNLTFCFFSFFCCECSQWENGWFVYAFFINESSVKLLFLFLFLFCFCLSIDSKQTFIQFPSLECC